MPKLRRISSYVLSGLVLTATPVLALGNYYRFDNQDIILKIDVKLIDAPNGPLLNVPFERLNLNTLAGDETFKTGDVVYVHTAIQNTSILYPFAISQNRTGKSENVASIRGIVTSINANTLTVDYNLNRLAERFQTNSQLFSYESVKAEISVNNRAVARLRALIVNGKRYPAKLS